MENGRTIKDFMYKEVSFWTGIMAIAVAAVLFVTQPTAEIRRDIALIKQDVQFIRTNELKHMQENWEKNEEFQKETRQELEDIQIMLAKILEKLK